MIEPPVIKTIQLFPKLDSELILLLKSLSEEEWNKPTIAKKWVVKDIAAHLLDGNIRTLSLSRDRHKLVNANPPRSYGELVNYLNELNAEWVTAFKRCSPEVLTELLEITGKEFCNYLATLDPNADAIFSVAWAGEDVSKNWFHIAREYTEKYIHQQQIRDAVGRRGLFSHELFYPCADTLLRGLPHTYRDVDAVNGDTIQIEISTDAGGNWFLHRADDRWKILYEYDGKIKASAKMDPDTTWKLFSKGISPGAAAGLVEIKGDHKLATPVLNLVAVMA